MAIEEDPIVALAVNRTVAASVVIRTVVVRIVSAGIAVVAAEPVPDRPKRTAARVPCLFSSVAGCKR